MGGKHSNAGPQGPAFVRPGHTFPRCTDPEGATPCATKMTVALNRRARHDFTIDETFEAGIVLTGTEIKSIRAGKANLSDAYARVEQNEAWLIGAHIAPFEQAQSLQPRAEADPQAPAPPLRDRRAARPRQGQGPDDRAAPAVHHATGKAKVELGPGPRQAAPRPAPGHRRPRRQARRRPRDGRRPARAVRPDDERPSRSDSGSDRSSRRSMRTRPASPGGSSSAGWRTSRARRCSTR